MLQKVCSHGYQSNHILISSSVILFDSHSCIMLCSSNLLSQVLINLISFSVSKKIQRLNNF